MQLTINDIEDYMSFESFELQYNLFFELHCNRLPSNDPISNVSTPMFLMTKRITHLSALIYLFITLHLVMGKYAQMVNTIIVFAHIDIVFQIFNQREVMFVSINSGGLLTSHVPSISSKFNFANYNLK
jgi:hypothetical protein